MLKSYLLYKLEKQAAGYAPWVTGGGVLGGIIGAQRAGEGNRLSGAWRGALAGGLGAAGAKATYGAVSKKLGKELRSRILEKELTVNRRAQSEYLHSLQEALKKGIPREKAEELASKNAAEVGAIVTKRLRVGPNVKASAAAQSIIPGLAAGTVGGVGLGTAAGLGNRVRETNPMIYQGSYGA